MKTCATCGQPVINGSVYFLRETGIALLVESIVVNGCAIHLTPCEYVLAKMMFEKIGDKPVSVKDFIWELYAYHEPDYAEQCIKGFLFNLRRKLDGTDLGIRSYPPFKYGFVEVAA